MIHSATDIALDRFDILDAEGLAPSDSRQLFTFPKPLHPVSVSTVLTRYSMAGIPSPGSSITIAEEPSDEFERVRSLGTSSFSVVRILAASSAPEVGASNDRVAPTADWLRCFVLPVTAPRTAALPLPTSI